MDTELLEILFEPDEFEYTEYEDNNDDEFDENGDLRELNF